MIGMLNFYRKTSPDDKLKTEFVILAALNS